MSVTLDFRLIDHQRIAVTGLKAVNDSIRDRNPEILRGYLATFPVEISARVVNELRTILSELHKLKGPREVIEDQERLLHFAEGNAYRPPAFRASTFDELRHLLGTWCWMNHCYSIGKSWAELGWFLEPIAELDEVSFFAGRVVGSDLSSLSIFAKALRGEADYPRDGLGEPVIRTCGTPGRDCSGYNPPPTAGSILSELKRVEPNSWDAHLPARYDLHRRYCPYLDAKQAKARASQELEFARSAFGTLLEAYSSATEKGYGVSCEYSL